MKKLSILFLIAGLTFSMVSCDKDENEEPDTPPTTVTPPDTTSSTVVEVDVFGLTHNHVKADGLSTDRLYRTIASKYTGGIDGLEYVDILVQGDIGHSVQVTLRGTELREGNFKLKKWALAGSFEESEAVVQVAVRKDGDTALMDFQTEDNASLSIKKDANGFFIIKMAPLVGINRNSWQPTITEQISFHLMSNPDKVVSSYTDDAYDNLFSYNTLYHDNSGQPRDEVVSGDVMLSFYDYDFPSAGTIPLTTYTLSSSAIDLMDGFNGTVPQSVHLSYSVNWVGWPANYNTSQNIEMELKENTIYVKFTDIEFVNPSDPSDVIVASGEWEMGR